MDNEKVELRKIPIRMLMEVLQAAWARGANYIDIIGNIGDIQDDLYIAVKSEYIDRDAAENDEEYIIEEEEENDDDDDGELTDDTLNSLL
jgi:hypothetical protein